MTSPIANPTRTKRKARLHIVLAPDCVAAAQRLTKDERRNISNLIEVLIIRADRDNQRRHNRGKGAKQ